MTEIKLEPDVVALAPCFVCHESPSYRPTGLLDVRRTLTEALADTIPPISIQEKKCEAAFFCTSCTSDLQQFEDINSNLEVLREQLAKIKELLSTKFQASQNGKGQASVEGGGPILGLVDTEFPASITFETGSGFEGGDDEHVLADDFDYDDPQDVDWDPNQREKPISKGKYKILSPSDELLNTSKRWIGKTESQMIFRRKARLKALLQRRQTETFKKEATAVLSGRKNKSALEFKCPKCPRRCRTEELLRFHSRKAHTDQDTPYDCVVCGLEFETLGELRNHERKTCIKKQEVAETAPVEKRVPAISARLDSEKTACESERVGCEKCRVLFKNMATFTLHLNRQGGECKKYSDLPPKCIFDRTQKKIHRFICGDCGRKYRSPHHLSIHIRSAHTDGFAFLCEYCCKPYNSKKSLESHQRREHVEEYLATKKDIEKELEKIKDLTCKFCSATLSTHTTKRLHEAKHVESFDYQCHICGAGFVDPGSLKSHISTHTGEKKYKCETCNHSFDRLLKLTRHMKAKHGVGEVHKPVQCHLCDKAFWEKTHMKRHLKLIHPNPDIPEANEFGCELCFYDCALREYLIVHSRTKKHMQKVQALGLSDPATGLKFPVDSEQTLGKMNRYRKKFRIQEVTNNEISISVG